MSLGLMRTEGLGNWQATLLEFDGQLHTKGQKTMDNTKTNKILRGSAEYQMLRERIDSSVMGNQKLREALEKRLEGKPAAQKYRFYDAMLYNSCSPEEIEYSGDGGFWGNSDLWGNFNYERAMAAVILSLIGYPSLEKAMKRVFGESVKVYTLVDNHSCISRVEIYSTDENEGRVSFDTMRALDVFAMFGMGSKGMEPSVLKRTDGTLYGVACAEIPLAKMVDAVKGAC